MQKTYSFKILLESNNVEMIDSKFYYSILWAFLSIFKNQNNIFNNIISLSPLNKNKNWDYFLIVSIFWKKNFNEIINEILEKNKNFTVNKKKFNIKWIEFDFKLFDLDSIEFKDFKKIKLHFLSPTYTKQSKGNKEIQNLLPNPEVFILSGIRKLNKYFKLDLDFENIKSELKSNIYVVEFDIKTKVVKIKSWLKAGVVWYINYRISDNLSLETKKLLYLWLHFSNLTWIWSWNKLWMGQVWVYFSN